MDMVNKAKSAISGNKSSSGAGAGAGAGGQKDMGDKGVNAIEQKLGFDKDGKYDKYEEKGTDMARGQFEKASGKNIPDKFSN